MTPRSTLLAPARAAVAAALLTASLAGCSSAAPAQEGLDRETAVAVDEALLHTVARAADALPEVSCVDVTLRQAGVPYTLPGDPVVEVRTTTTGAAARDALARDLGRQVWEAGLTTVLSLTLLVVGPDGASDLGRLLTGSPGAVSREDLVAAYGPRPSPTLTTPPPDPGPPECA